MDFGDFLMNPIIQLLVSAFIVLSIFLIRQSRKSPELLIREEKARKDRDKRQKEIEQRKFVEELKSYDAIVIDLINKFEKNLSDIDQFLNVIESNTTRCSACGDSRFIIDSEKMKAAYTANCRSCSKKLMVHTDHIDKATEIAGMNLKSMQKKYYEMHSDLWHLINDNLEFFKENQEKYFEMLISMPRHKIKVWDSAGNLFVLDENNYKGISLKSTSPVYLDSQIMEFNAISEVETKINMRNHRSRRIPQDVQDRVWNRDGGQCVNCGSKENLEFDHIIPHSKGGANTYRNIQLLCEKCNRSKSDSIG